MDPRAAFDADGVVHLPGRMAPAAVAALRDAAWAALATRGIERDAPATWAAGGGLPLIEVAGALRPAPAAAELLWQIGRDPVFAPVPRLLQRALDEVFGPDVWAPVDDGPGGLLMPNFPAAAAWEVPHAAWHMDEPMAPRQPLPWGMLGFLLLDDVAPGGGATVVVAGSPRRLAQLADDAAAVVTTDTALAALVDEPWYGALLDRDRTAPIGPGWSGDVPQRIVELVGAAGDLTLMDPRCLHTVSANASSRARLTLRLVCGRA